MVIPRLPRSLVAAVAALVALYVVETLVPFAGAGVHDWVRDWGVELLYLLAAVGCGVRVWRCARDRLAWALLTAGVACYGLTTALYVLTGSPDLTRSPLHIGWLSFYVFAYVGIVLALRARLRPFHMGFWLDGLVGILVLAAVASAFLLPDLTDRQGGATSDVILGVVYPTADVVLLAMVVWALTLTGRRAGRMWLVLAGAFALFAAGDIWLAVQVAQDAFERGTLVSTTFPIATLLIAYAAYQPGAAPRSLRMDGLLVLVAPACYAVAALMLLLAGQTIGLPTSAKLLALLAVAAVLVRALVTVRELGRLHESRRFERGFQDAAIGMALVSPQLRYLKVNDALCRLVGRPADDLIGRTVASITHPDDHDRTRLLADGAAAEVEKRLLRADGSTVDVAISTTRVLDDEEPYFFTQIQDISGRRRGERRTAATLELSRRAMSITDPAALMREAADVLEEVLATTRVFVSRQRDEEDPEILVRGAQTPGTVPTRVPKGSVTGYALAHGAWAATEDLCADDRFVAPPALVEAGLTRALAVPVPRRGDDGYAITAFRRRDEPRFCTEEIAFVEGIAHTLATAIDRADMEAVTRHQALHDPLTGLANRAFLSGQLEQALSAAARDHTTVAVLLLDIDRFKVVNDALGHTAGDDLLVEVAGRLRGIVRDADVAARLGGDEFVVACPQIHVAHDVAVLAQRIVDAFAVPFHAGGRAWHLGASIGVALSGPGARAGDLLRDADLAMYRAKDRGGGRYEVFDEDLRERVVERLSLEASLRQAVERDELVLHYQPIVDLGSGALESFEALVRWQHPQRGLLGPGEFITIAEDTDLILPIGDWVLRRVCDQLASWSATDAGGDAPHVRVNLSPRQITPSLPRTIATAVARAGIAPSQLGLEITERLLIEEPSASRVLQEVQALGVTVALDDFGTGYSSLGFLRDHPVDVLKLDRSLIAGIGPRREATAIVKAAVDMAAALELSIVAEGIEHPDQAHVLLEMGCRLGQGFAFSPAVPAGDATRMLATRAQTTSSP